MKEINFYPYIKKKRQTGRLLTEAQQTELSPYVDARYLCENLDILHGATSDYLYS